MTDDLIRATAKPFVCPETAAQTGMSVEERKERKLEQGRAWHAAYRAADPEAARKRERAYYAATAEKRRELNRAHYAANQEQRRESGRASYARNAEKKRQQKRKFRSENPEKVKEQNNAYVARHKEKILAQKRAERRANPEKYTNLHLKKKFGMTLAEYDTRLASQNGGCAVCGTEARTKRLHVDHCHTTGEVRGIICNNCNLALGLVKDSPATLRKLIIYLETHKLVGSTHKAPDA